MTAIILANKIKFYNQQSTMDIMLVFSIKKFPLTLNRITLTPGGILTQDPIVIILLVLQILNFKFHSYLQGKAVMIERELCNYLLINGSVLKVCCKSRQKDNFNRYYLSVRK